MRLIAAPSTGSRRIRRRRARCVVVFRHVMEAVSVTRAGILESNAGLDVGVIACDGTRTRMTIGRGSP